MNLFKRVKMFFGNPHDLDGFFDSLEKNGPVNTVEAGRKIPMCFSDPTMQMRYDANLCVRCGNEPGPCGLCGGRGMSAEDPRLLFFSAKGGPVDIEEYLAEQYKVDKFRAHYTDMATRHGWKSEEGEGAVEFLIREAYTTGHQDAITREGRVRVSAPLLAEAAAAIELLAESQADSDVGKWWGTHYGSLARQFRKMLAKASKSNG